MNAYVWLVLLMSHGTQCAMASAARARKDSILSAASLRALSVCLTRGSNLGPETKKILASMEYAMLRYTANYPINVMIAWGMCCRYPLFSLSPQASAFSFADRSPYGLEALGSGILLTYPEISTIAGVQGLVVYTLSSSLPLLVFGALGPMIRRKCPEGFVLTEWTRQRYGIVAALYLSAMT